MTGKIKRIIKEKHYGFIDGDDGYSYFFHGSNLVIDPENHVTQYAEDDIVSFDPIETPKGKAAVNIIHAEA